VSTSPPPRVARPGSPISVIIPCFNHGVYLDECLESVEAQTLPAAEVIVLDDGSTDQHTLDVLARVEQDGRARIIRQANTGPSAARNRAVAASSGELVLPLDADNRLAPNALAVMADKLHASPERVRWVYPHQQFFGNRDELAVMPEFNLWILLARNFCDTCSLIDRSVFDVGCRYREDIGLGHEDWDFFLAAAEHGFIGASCPDKVLFVRKHGFTRSDLVDHQFGAFTTEIRRLHPRLYEPQNLLRVKQEWSPALSVVVEGATSAVPALLDAQAFQDFELVGQPRRDGKLQRAKVGPVGGDWVSPADAVDLLDQAKGRWVLLWSGGHIGPMADPAFLEKATVIAEHSTGPVAVVLGIALHPDTAFDWQRAGQDDISEPIGLLVGAELLHELVPSLDVSSLRNCLTMVLSALTSEVPDLAWRSFPVPKRMRRPRPEHAQPVVAARPAAEPPSIRPPRLAPATTSDPQPELAAHARTLERQFRQQLAAPFHVGHASVTRLPRPPRGRDAKSWRGLMSKAWECWVPDHTRLLVLEVDTVRCQYEVGFEQTCPLPSSGIRVPLGRIYTHAFPGTVALWRGLDRRTGSFHYLLGEPPTRSLHSPLGHVSTAHLPGMVPLQQVVETQLERLGLRIGGKPLSFRLGGEQVTACMEPVEHTPGGPADDPAAPSTLWTLYEIIGPDGRCSYACHPDAVATRSGGHAARPVARIAAPGRTAKALVEEVDLATGGRSYLNDSGPSDGGRTATTLGSLLTGRYADARPLVRLIAVTAGPHSAVGEPGHRLAETRWGHLVDGGSHVPEGILGDAAPAERERLPLFRWRHATRAEWRYSLGARLADAAGGEWHLDGTLGLAYTPYVDWAALIDLVELRDARTGRYSYAVGDPPIGGCTMKVVARLHRVHEDDALPLFRLEDGHGHELYAVNPTERHAEGYRAEGPFAYVGVAVPLPPPAAAASTESGMRRLTILDRAGAVLVDGVVREHPAPGTVPLASTDEGRSLTVEEIPDRTVLGHGASAPFPWSIPLYELVERRTGTQVLSTNGELALARTHAVRRVVAYLGWPDGPAQTTEPADRGVETSGPTETTIALPLKQLLRAGAAHLPAPARRALAPAWRRLTRPPEISNGTDQRSPAGQGPA
jgi:hypothetical protein